MQTSFARFLVFAEFFLAQRKHQARTMCILLYSSLTIDLCLNEFYFILILTILNRAWKLQKERCEIFCNDAMQIKRVFNGLVHVASKSPFNQQIETQLFVFMKNNVEDKYWLGPVVLVCNPSK